MDPFFSILVPAFNMSGKMQACVDSLLAQSMPDFEVIIVDDGSTDDTYQYLLELANADRRFSAWRHDINRSLLAARYTAMEHARGAYVLFVDSDDWLSSDTLEELHAFLSEDPVDIVRFGHVWEPDGKVFMPPVSGDPLLDFMEGKISPQIWKNAYKLDVIKNFFPGPALFTATWVRTYSSQAASSPVPAPSAGWRRHSTIMCSAGCQPAGRDPVKRSGEIWRASPPAESIFSRLLKSTTPLILLLPGTRCGR